MTDDWELEQLLRRAMPSRPPHVPAFDLARRATAIAATDIHLATEPLRRLARHRFWNRFVGVAAAVLVTIVIGLGAARLSSQTGVSIFSQAGGASVGSTASDASATSDTSVIQTSTLFVAELLAAALILLSAGPLFTRPAGGAEGLVPG